MPQGPPNPRFMQEKVQEGDFLKKPSREDELEQRQFFATHFRTMCITGIPYECIVC